MIAGMALVPCFPVVYRGKMPGQQWPDGRSPMPARFDKLGISFQYPENWTLDDSDALLGRKSVTVYSPGGAFWSVAIHSGSADPAKLAAAVVETMKKEYPGLEVDETERDGGRPRPDRLRPGVLLPGSDQHGPDSQPAGWPNHATRSSARRKIGSSTSCRWCFRR